MNVKFFAFATALLLPLASASSLFAIDVVTGSATNSGDIQSVSPTEVVLNKPGNQTVKIPVNEIRTIRFTGEPPQLNLLRGAVLAGNYEAGLRTLENDALDPTKAERIEVKQEIEFFRALAKARLALDSGDRTALNEAGTLMRDFVTEQKGSWHLLEAQEVLGDIYLAIDQPKLAIEQYQAVENAPWPDVKAQGAVARGRALEKTGDYAAASQAYDAGLSATQGADTPSAKAQNLAATVGKASCMAQTGNPEGGIEMLQKVIAEADPENTQLHAVAYTTLGNCYRKSGKEQDALLAFLHVDVLYYVYPQYHAEALYNLVSLWKTVGKPDRSLQAQKLLAERYSGSKWASMQ